MKLLIIHSHQHVRQNLKTVFSNEYFAVDGAGDIKKGLVSACVNDYQVVIVEHALPQSDALWFCSELRRRERTVPILVLIDEDNAAGTSCLENGADDFVRHPLAHDELVARVRCLVRRPREIQADVISVGHLCVNRKSRVVKCNGRDVPLTRKEYMILELLALRHGAIVSKTEIIEHSWDDSEDQFLEAAVDTHIYRLRRKIERRGQKLIRTFMGRGYRLG